MVEIISSRMLSGEPYSPHSFTFTPHFFGKWTHFLQSGTEHGKGFHDDKTLYNLKNRRHSNVMDNLRDIRKAQKK
jgi:hypothetical protein